MREKMNRRTLSLGRLRVGVASATVATIGLLGTGVAFAADQSPSSSTPTEVTTSALDSVGGLNDQVGSNVQDQSGADAASTSLSTETDAAEVPSSTGTDPAGGSLQLDGVNVGSTGTGVN